MSRKGFDSLWRLGGYVFGPADLFPARALDNGDVAVDRKFGEGFQAAAGLWPSNLQLVNLCAAADAQNFAGIVRGEITSSAHLQPAPFQIVSLPRDSCPDSVRIRLLSHETYPQPMVSRSCHVLKQHRCSIIDRDQCVYCTIVIEITDRHPASGKALRESRSGSGTDIFESASAVMK